VSENDPPNHDQRNEDSVKIPEQCETATCLRCGDAIKVVTDGFPKLTCKCGHVMTIYTTTYTCQCDHQYGAHQGGGKCYEQNCSCQQFEHCR
jgi:hypothetical protein